MTTTLIRNGVLWSEGTRLEGDAVLIEDGRISAIGPEGDLLQLLDGRPARTVDAEGGLVAPSFADAHVHVSFGGIELNSLDLSSATDARECLELIREFAQTCTAEWITGGGWEMPWFEGGTPTAELLDTVTEGRPAFILNADHHGAWVNTRALEIAGISADTADPADGRLERDARGFPSGTVHEGAQSLLAPFVPKATTAEVVDGIRRGATVLNAAGVTAWQEALVGDYDSFVDCAPGYRALIADGGLTARISGALWVPRETTIDQVGAVVSDLMRRREVNAAAGFDTSTAKIMIDGVAENRTAALHEPYLVDGCTCGTERGIAYFGRDVLFALARELMDNGFSLHFHAIGDRAVTDALDAVEQVPADKRAGLRHHIAHVQIVDPGDIERFRSLDVTVNAQALWACNEQQMTELTVPIIGETRAAWQYPFGSFERAGADLAMGSDWPVSTYDPWHAIHVAVNRRAPGSDAPALNPGEEITLTSALTAYTAGSHRLLGFSRSGMLAVGADADLCIADRDPFAAPAEQIYLTRTRLTMLAGQILQP
ncbi:MAG: amidohydrolase [Lacisediminihabitans sp.]